MLTVVQSVLHKNHIYPTLGWALVHSDGPEAFKEIRIVFFFIIIISFEAVAMQMGVF